MARPETPAVKDKKWAVARAWPYAAIAALYVFASWLTRPVFQGDTRDYVDSILARGKGRYFEFWDFGHLLWRPVGWVAFHAWGPLLARFLGPDQRAQAALALIVVSWLAGLASALLLLGLVQAYCASEWIAALVATAFIFSTAELNYSRSGSPYIPGLALLLLGMCLLTQAATRPAENAGMPALAGLALAGSVSLWFLYLLAVPAAIFVPFMWEASNKERFRISASALLVFSLAIVSIYLLVLSRLGFAGPAEILSWARSSSHGIVISGVSRTIFGWPRSFLALDEAGRVIKRIELGDPFHPVSSRDLFRLSYAGAALSLFYVSVVSIIFKLRRSWRGRKILLLAAMAAFPVLGFAMHWSGGDLERYLPLYPAFFLALGLSLADRDAWRATSSCMDAGPVRGVQQFGGIRKQCGQALPSANRGSRPRIAASVENRKPDYRLAQS